MASNEITNLFGGGMEINIAAESTGLLSVKATVPEGGRVGYLHLDLSDAVDLRDALAAWIAGQGR